MSERVEAYFRMLERVSDEELDATAQQLARYDKRNDARLIAHLVEIAERKCHLKLSYGNMFDYCVGRLRMSNFPRP